MTLSASSCSKCYTELSPRTLACPKCGRLVHSERLKELANKAEEHALAKEGSEAIGAWREVLELLPPKSKQSIEIGAKIEELSKTAKVSTPIPKALAAFGALGLLVWKFKFLLVLLASKGKWLLLGLSKAGTIKSMGLFVAVLGSEIGWQLALGLVISIYIHEMGHVAALGKHGIKAEPPMFIPGIGAFVRLKQRPANVKEDADIGLAGPVWGLAAALVCGALFWYTDSTLWGSLTIFGAMINLFNLVPVWQLDGARGASALTRGQRSLLLVIGLCLYGLAESKILLGFAFFMVIKVISKGPDKASWPIFFLYSGLLVALSVLSAIPVSNSF